MPRSQSVPNYRLHKPTGQAVVTLRPLGGDRRDVYLGRYGSPTSKAEYARVIAEAQAGLPDTPALLTSHGPPVDVLSVNELVLQYRGHAEQHYRDPDGRPTSELKEIKLSLRPVRELYGHTKAAAFGPKALAAVREAMVRAVLARTLINRRIDRVKRCFKWAAAEELVPVSTYQALRTLSGLQAGRTAARESDPVAPVPAEHFVATLPYLPRVPRAVAELQRWTGMRPGEVCRLTLAELDMSGPVWMYRPSRHKTRHRGKTRVVSIGPRGQAVLLAFLAGRTPAPAGAAGYDLTDPAARREAAAAFAACGRLIDAALLRDVSRPIVFLGGSVLDPDWFVFDAARDREERFAAMRLARKSKLTPSQVCRRKAAPRRVPAPGYRPLAYAHAVERACKAAGVEHWHPNRLRHLYATEVRRLYGLEAAQVMLGHAKADVTQVYAERDTALAVRVAAEAG